MRTPSGGRAVTPAGTAPQPKLCSDDDGAAGAAAIGAAGVPGTREEVPHGALRRCVAAVPPRGRALVPVVALAAGLLFATSGRTAQGTDLRAGEVTELSELIAQRDDRRSPGRTTSSPTCRSRWSGSPSRRPRRDGAVAAAQSAGDAGALSAALVPLTGPGRGHHPRRRPRRGRTAACRSTPGPTTWSSTSPTSRPS